GLKLQDDIDAALIKPIETATAAARIPAATSPRSIRSGSCLMVMRKATNVSAWTISATAPHTAQSSSDNECVMALDNGKAKPINAPPKARAPEGLLARIRAKSSWGVTQV